MCPADRAEGPRHATAAQPGLGSSNQTGEYVSVVDCFDKSEMASIISMSRKMKAINLCANSSNRQSLPAGHEELTLGMLKEGIMFGGETQLSLQQQLRYPMWAIAINAVRKTMKPTPVGPRRHGIDLNKMALLTISLSLQFGRRNSQIRMNRCG
jgi:hypothetical protein